VTAVLNKVFITVRSIKYHFWSEKQPNSFEGVLFDWDEVVILNKVPSKLAGRFFKKLRSLTQTYLTQHLS
jgi:hypothetical protein